MSLGWQTESALLPSKAKPIKVDNKSMVGLKSILLQEEKQRAMRLAQDPDGLQKSMSRHLHGFSEKLTDPSQLNQSKKRTYPPHQHHESIRRQNRNEPATTSIEEELSTEKRARLALEVKAKIYEELQQQQLTSGHNTHSESMLDATLIDFQAKVPNETTAQLNDEETEDFKVNPTLGEGKVVLGAPQYHWSTGTSNSTAGSKMNEFQKEKQCERQLKTMVEETLRHSSEYANHSQNNSHSATNNNKHATVSHGARVKSQWEKLLGEEAKDMADQVHLETEQVRKQLQQQRETHRDSSPSTAKADETVLTDRTQSLNAPANPVHNERLELLRRKREQLLAQQKLKNR